MSWVGLVCLVFSWCVLVRMGVSSWCVLVWLGVCWCVLIFFYFCCGVGGVIVVLLFCNRHMVCVWGVLGECYVCVGGVLAWVMWRLCGFS